VSEAPPSDRGPKSKHPLFDTYHAMLARCHKKAHRHYAYYGGRGLTVCQRWRDSFWDFVDDVGERPPGTELDRIDNSKGYEPGNVRFVPHHENLRNRRNTVWYELDGTRVCMADFARAHGMSPQAFRGRKEMGWKLDRILSTPIHPRKPKSARVEAQ
jgi:hypothetical protein